MSGVDTPVAGPVEPSVLERLVRAAGQAPSGDNTQPWRFDVAPSGRAIDVVLDPDRDRSPMNAGQRMALIACGAAVENLDRLARALGYRTEVEAFPPGPLEAPTRVARVALGGQGTADDAAAVELALSGRVSNRRVYDGRALDEATRAALAASTAGLPGMDVHWVTERAIVERLANRIREGDVVMFGEPSMRHAFLGNVRFDLPADATADEGLSFGSLEATAADRLALRAMRVLPDRLFALAGGARMLGNYSRKLVRSSSGACLVVPRAGSDDALQVGRAAQHVWLALNGAGLAAQPMMSLPGLDFALAHGSPELVRSLERLGVREALGAFDRFLGSAGISGRPRFLLRFGYAAPPTCRVGRRRSA